VRLSWPVTIPEQYQQQHGEGWKHRCYPLATLEPQDASCCKENFASGSLFNNPRAPL
jgi:hypothetical protein